jgi:NTP pyrophosphatase (non-canonical NTP hydrolase)
MQNILTLNHYQELALKTARYPNVGKNLTYPILGLIGEVGEVAELWATQGLTDSFKGDNLLEYGDVLWYYATCCHELGHKLADLPSFRSFYIDSFQGLQKLFPNVATWDNVKSTANKMMYTANLTANIVKKIQRDDAGNLTTEKKIRLMEYLADSFLAWSDLLVQFEVDLAKVAEDNIKKLNG